MLRSREGSKCFVVSGLITKEVFRPVLEWLGHPPEMLELFRGYHTGVYKKQFRSVDGTLILGQYTPYQPRSEANMNRGLVFNFGMHSYPQKLLLCYDKETGLVHALLDTSCGDKCQLDVVDSDCVCCMFEIIRNLQLKRQLFAEPLTVAAIFTHCALARVRLNISRLDDWLLELGRQLGHMDSYFGLQVNPLNMDFADVTKNMNNTNDHIVWEATRLKSIRVALTMVLDLSKETITAINIDRASSAYNRTIAERLEIVEQEIGFMEAERHFMELHVEQCARQMQARQAAVCRFVASWEASQLKLCLDIPVHDPKRHPS